MRRQDEARRREAADRGAAQEDFFQRDGTSEYVVVLEPRVDPSYVAREELRVSARDAANVPVNALGYLGQGSGVPSFGGVPSLNVMSHQSKSEELDQKELDDALVEYLQTDDYDFLASVTIQGVERILDKGGKSRCRQS